MILNDHIATTSEPNVKFKTLTTFRLTSSIMKEFTNVENIATIKRVKDCKDLMHREIY